MRTDVENDQEPRCGWCGRAVGEQTAPGHVEAGRLLREEVSTLPEDKARQVQRLLEAQDALDREATPVEILVAGAGVYICDQCVEACVEYIRLKRTGRVA